MKSVGQKGQELLQFNHPSGVEVHPYGRVFVADSLNNHIQVLNPDLLYSHMFGSKGRHWDSLAFRMVWPVVL